MISKELKSQLSILKETNPEYIQTLKDAVTASYKAELQAIKPSSTEEEEQLNIELKDIVLKMLFGPFLFRIRIRSIRYYMGRTG